MTAEDWRVISSMDSPLVHYMNKRRKPKDADITLTTDNFKVKLTHTGNQKSIKFEKTLRFKNETYNPAHILTIGVFNKMIENVYEINMALTFLEKINNSFKEYLNYSTSDPGMLNTSSDMCLNSTFCNLFLNNGS